MGKNTIVLLRSNPVDPDSRVEKEANSLLKAGYNVNILAWDRFSKYEIKESVLTLEHGNCKIYRFGIPASFGEGFKNLKSFIVFQWRLFVWLMKNRKNYQIIHACDFDTGYTAYQCSRILKKKLVYDIFDYLFTYTDGKYSYLKKIIVKLQHKIINKADATIICTENRKEQIKGTNPKNLTIIHNTPQQKTFSLSKLNLNKNKVKIVYVGIFQDGRLLKGLAEVVRKNPKYELHIGGFGKYDKFFKDLALSCSNIIYYGRLSYDKTIELEDSCDIMTAIYDPSIGNHYYAAPNKFYESLMLGKPIIMVSNTGMSSIVKKYDIGELINYDEESLEQAIENLIKRKNEWNKISFKMRTLYKEQYSWEEMERRLIALYGRLEN